MTEVYEQILQDFLALPGDYKGEAVAAELIQCGVLHDKLYFRTISSFKRPTGKDIAGIRLDIKESGTEQLLLELNREGLYDMLPEGIFHFKDARKGKDKDVILEDIKKARDEELQARKFFGPFENEFFQLRLQLELKKRALLQPGSAETNRELFETVFGDATLLNNHQLLTLLYLLPMAHKIRGDIEKIAYCISILILHKTNITLVKTHFRKQFDGEIAALGGARLGITTIAGNSFSEQEVCYDIRISDVGKENLVSFFSGGANFSVIKYIVGFLLPANYTYSIKLHLKKEDREAFLSDDKNEIYLSFNSYL